MQGNSEEGRIEGKERVGGEDETGEDKPVPLYEKLS